MTRTEGLAEALLHTTLIDNLLRLEIRDKFVDVYIIALRNIELARRKVEEGNTRGLLAEIYRCKEGVLLARNKVLAHNDTRRHHLHHTTLNQALNHLRVFELLADGYALTSTHQLRHIGIEGVVRESRKLDIRRSAIGTTRERDAEYSAGLDGILAEGLVEVTHTEEQNGVGVHRFNLIILFHQRRLDIPLLLRRLCLLFCCTLFWSWTHCI